MAFHSIFPFLTLCSFLIQTQNITHTAFYLFFFFFFFFFLLSSFCVQKHVGSHKNSSIIHAFVHHIHHPKRQSLLQQVLRITSSLLPSYKKHLSILLIVHQLKLHILPITFSLSLSIPTSGNRYGSFEYPIEAIDWNDKFR